MIEISNDNCPSYRIICSNESNPESKSGTCFLVAENRILTARHVVSDVIAMTHSAWVDIPEQGQINLRICILDGNPAVTDSLALLEPVESQQLPKPLPLYRPAAAPKSYTRMDAYGYLGSKSNRNQYQLIEYAVYRAAQLQEHGEERNAQFKVHQSPDRVPGLSGSPIFCAGHLFGVLNTEDYVNKKTDYVYGFCGECFFRDLQALGIRVPMALVSPELPKAAFELPKPYQARMAEQLRTAMKKQSESRKDGRQPPIFLRGPDGIGKMEFFREFAEQYHEGYVYHLSFINNFQFTLDGAPEGIIEKKHADTAEKQLKLLRECSEADILIITGADFANGYLSKDININNYNNAYKKLCELPLHLIIATRQPILEDLGGCTPLEMELKPQETELADWLMGMLTLPDRNDAKILVKQVDHNPLLIRRIRDILLANSDLTPAGMVEALQNPGKDNANAYLNISGKHNLFDLLKKKIPQPNCDIKNCDIKNCDIKNPNSTDCDTKKNYEISKSILMLILDELDVAQEAQEAPDATNEADKYLTAEEFMEWVHSLNRKEQQKCNDMENIAYAFEKLYRIGMIERSSKGCYSIPIIPRLLLKKENPAINHDIYRNFSRFRTKAFNARQQFESAGSKPEAKAEQLLNALVQVCADPYDSFSLFCASNRQELETHLPELFAFGNYINHALVTCYYGDDPKEKLKKAEATLELFCQDEQSQRTILVAKLYDTFHSALYMLNHSENTDPDACCNALVRLFDAVLELHPKFPPCYTMKSQVYWYFGKEYEAFCEAEVARECAERLHGHYCADALMIQGQYLENQADKLRNSDAAKSSNCYEQAFEKYQQTYQIRSSIGRQNLQRSRRNLSRLIQCYGKWYSIEPKSRKCNSKCDWVQIYGMALLEYDRKIFQDCTIDADFVEDIQTLLVVCSIAEKGSRADADNSNVKYFSKIKSNILKYIQEHYPTETAHESIFTWLENFEKWLVNPDYT